MKKLIIDRKTWLNGEGAGASFLLRPNDNKMCCLGFMALDLGFSATDISNVGKPSNCNVVEPWIKLGLLDNTFNSYENELASLLMETNDDKNLSSQERECSLKELFKEINIDVEFIN